MNMAKLGRNLALYVTLGTSLAGMGCAPKPVDPSAPVSFDNVAYYTKAKDSSGKEKDATVVIAGRRHKDGRIDVEKYLVRMGDSSEGAEIDGSNSKTSRYTNGIEVAGIRRIQDHCWSDNYGKMYTVINFNVADIPLLGISQCGKPSETEIRGRQDEIYRLVIEAAKNTVGKQNPSVPKTELQK